MGTVTFTLDDLSVPAPAPSSLDWNDEGVVILKNFIPEDLIEAYTERWRIDNVDRPNGYPQDTPYMNVKEVADICLFPQLANELETLMGEPAGLHLNLSGWISTERDWHQDTYLNEDEVGDHYAAVWLALDDIHPDSGPFQYIPGSHLWHRLVRDRIADHVDMNDPNWPKHTEDFMSDLVVDEIAKREAEIVTYLPKKGDVLIWHSRLYHRGSKANVPGMERRALIAHYSGIHHRSLMPTPVQYVTGAYAFPIDQLR